MLQPSTPIISSWDSSAWSGKREATLCVTWWLTQPRTKAAFSTVAFPSPTPPSCSATHGTAPWNQHTAEARGAARSSQPNHLSDDSGTADSSPALYRTPSTHASQNLYAGNCETAFLQTLGLVMSLLTTDPCVCHGSRVEYKHWQQSSSHYIIFCQPRPRCCWA